MTPYAAYTAAETPNAFQWVGQFTILGRFVIHGLELAIWSTCLTNLKSLCPPIRRYERRYKIRKMGWFW